MSLASGDGGMVSVEKKACAHFLVAVGYGTSTDRVWYGTIARRCEGQACEES